MMWHPPPVTNENLRLIVQDAPEGADISLPPGEFEGPFLLDRPLRLVGRGDRPEATTLWTRRGPAVIVRSPGVSLANLSVELTFPEARQNDATIWYQAECRPDVQTAQIRGQIEQMGKKQSSGGWKLPDLISLGDLRAKHSVTLPMVIQVPGPAKLSGELTNLHVQPTRLPAGGEHLIRIGIPQGKLFKDTMLAGQLVIESGGETRAVWIIGRVLEEEFKAWVKDKIVLVGKSGRRYGFGPGMLLGKEQLRGEAGADRIAEKQAYIMKESSGVWSLIQPLPANQPTLIDGRSLDVGRRQLIKGGEVIKIGSLELTVDAQKTSLPISVDGTVDFGKLSARATVPPPTIKVQNNYKRKKWEGTLRSTVPWIRVPQPQVICPGGKTEEVPVQLGTGLNSLPKQLINYTGALVLEGDKESWLISAQVDIDVEEGLEVEPSTLDFGPVSDPTGINPKSLRLRNVGSADWQGVVQVTVPWLVVDRTSLQCAAGADTKLEVRLTDEVMTLSEGANTATDAIKIEGQGLSATVCAKLEFKKPKVVLSVEPRSLDWDKITDWRAAKSLTLEVHNRGDKDWQGKATSHTDWLEVEPTTVQCPAQSKTPLTVRLTERFQGLSAGEQKVPAAIRLQGEGQSFSILARLEVDVPPIQADRSTIDLVLDDRSVLPRETLRLQNRGGQDWHGSVTSTLRWLEVNPTDVTCPANAEVEIDIALSPQVSKIFRRPRQVRVDNAIRIEGGGAPLLVGVVLEVKASTQTSIPVDHGPPPSTPEKKEKKPKDAVPTAVPATGLAVDFGQVSDWTGKMPAREIRLSNSQSQVMEGTVRSTLPWLEVEPTSFRCPPGQDVVITARLTDQASSLRPKTYDVADAVIIESGGKKHQVNARLAVVRISPTTRFTSPSPTPEESEKEAPAPSPGLAGLAVDFGRVSDWTGKMPAREIRLSNSQPQVMEGTVRSTLPWLEVEPTSFRCPPKQEVVITARLTDQAPGLRPKTYDVADAVIIECGGKKHQVNARLVVVPASPLPPFRKPSPTPEKEAEKAKEQIPATVRSAGLAVDFGRVSDWTGEMPAREIRLSNSQSQVMEGRVRSTLPWLEVEPASFRCPPGQEVVITARLTDRASSLRPKTYDVADAVIIESGGKKHQVNAHLIIGRAPVATSFRPSSSTPGKEAEKAKEQVPATIPAAGLAVDFGRVSDWSGEMPAREIRLSNSQSQVMEGTVRSTLPWLEVEPASFRCPPNQEAVITARLTDQASSLRPKTYDVADAVIIECGGKKHPVNVCLTVVRSPRPMMRTIRPPIEPGQAVSEEPAKSGRAKAGEKVQPEKPTKALAEALLLDPTSLDMGAVSEWTEPLPAHQVELTNGLKTDWTGTVKSTVPWLEVSPTEIDCPAGASVTLDVRLTQWGGRLRARTYSAPDALLIEGDGQTFAVDVQMTVK